MVNKRENGFTILEMAVSLCVISLAAAASISLLSESKNYSSFQAEQQMLAKAKNSLLEFSMKKFRLPCPDTTGTGWEGDGSGACPASIKVGLLPYKTLNLDERLAGGKKLRYGVFRGLPNGDLGTPPVSNAGAGFRKFSEVTRGAAASPAVSDQPYLADRKEAGLPDDCSLPGSYPAFVITLDSAENHFNDLCFADSAYTTSMSRAELAGWAQHNSY